MKRSGIDILAILSLIAAIVCWGVPPVMLRYMAQHKIVPDGFTTNFVRYPVATISYIPLLISARRRGVKLGSFWKWALLPATVNIIGQTLFAIAPYHMDAGIMSFLLRLSTIWSTLLAFILFADERVLARNPHFWFAAAIALFGFLLMSIIGNRGFEIGVAGIVLILICSICWGLYDVTVRLTMGRLHPLIVFGVIGNYSSVGLLMLGPKGDLGSLSRMGVGGWVLLIVSAYIGIAAAHGMYYIALQRLGVAVSSVAMLLSPFVTIIVSAAFLGERFSGLQWLGGVLLVGGASLALWTRFQSRRMRPEQEAAAVAPD